MAETKEVQSEIAYKLAIEEMSGLFIQLRKRCPDLTHREVKAIMDEACANT